MKIIIVLIFLIIAVTLTGLALQLVNTSVDTICKMNANDVQRCIEETN
jgi:hypothetical protein